MTNSVAMVSARGGFIYRWESRHKLLAFTALIFGFAFVRDLRLLPLMLAVSCFIYYLSALPLSYLALRMRLPGIFLLALAVILPFWSGQTVLAQLGPLAIRLEGSLNLLLIAVKFISILTVVTVLFTSTPLATLVAAMRSLGVPLLLSEMLLFTHRYIFQLTDDLRRTRSAALLRGFKGKSLLSVKTLAYIVGTLLVRSNAQSERVFQAMTLRGYGRDDGPVMPASSGLTDRLALAGVLILAASFVLIQSFVL